MYIHSTYDTNTQRHQHIPFYMCVHLYIFLFVSLVRFFLLIPFIFVILLYQRLWFWASYVPFWPVYAASRGIHEGLIKNHLKERVKKKNDWNWIFQVFSWFMFAYIYRCVLSTRCFVVVFSIAFTDINQNETRCAIWYDCGQHYELEIKHIHAQMGIVKREKFFFCVIAC